MNQIGLNTCTCDSGLFKYVYTWFRLICIYVHMIELVSIRVRVIQNCLNMCTRDSD